MNIVNVDGMSALLTMARVIRRLHCHQSHQQSDSDVIVFEITVLVNAPVGHNINDCKYK